MERELSRVNQYGEPLQKVHWFCIVSQINCLIVREYKILVIRSYESLSSPHLHGGPVEIFAWLQSFTRTSEA